MSNDAPSRPPFAVALRAVPATGGVRAAEAPEAPIRPLAADSDGVVETLRKLWRHQRTIAACTIAAGALSIAVALSLPSWYVAEARLLVGLQVLRDVGADAALPDSLADSGRVQNERFVLQSRLLARQAVDALRRDRKADFEAELQSRSFWRRALDLQALLGDGVAAPPDEPAAGGDTGEERRIDALLSRVEVAPLGRSHVLGIRAEARTPEMAAAIANTLVRLYLDDRRADAVAALGPADQPPSDRSVADRIEALRAEVRKADQAVDDFRQHGPDKESARMPAPRDPAMVKARVEVDGTKVGAKAGVATDAGRTADGPDLEALKRDAAAAHGRLDTMLARARTAAGESADAKLLSPAVPPRAPSYPPRPAIAVLGTLGGLLLGCAIALLRENNDRTFRRADQLEALTGLPVLAMVPQLTGRVPAAMEVLRHPTSPYSEALRRLQIGVELAPAAAPRTLLFTSAMPQEGKSVMVASLGRLLASNGRRVLLVDCDWRSPQLHRIFGGSNSKGLASLLGDSAGIAEVIHHDALSGVDVLPAGTWSPNQAHLVSSSRMRQLLAALAPDYDFILLDTAPALLTADVLALSGMVEKVVLVVRWGHTRQDAAAEALKQIVESRARVAGLVLSRVVSRDYRRYAYRDPFHDHSRPGAAAHG